MSYEQDPYLLQNIMDKNSANMTCRRPIRLMQVSLQMKGLQWLLTLKSNFPQKVTFIGHVLWCVLHARGPSANVMEGIFKGMVASTDPATVRTASE
jgi:hypothetical protein